MSKITCKCSDKQCDVEGGREFFFSDKEQKFYKEKGFTPPKRCWPCRERRRNQADSPFKPAFDQMKKNVSDREMLE